jgi:hypothetical protein
LLTDRAPPTPTNVVHVVLSKPNRAPLSPPPHVTRDPRPACAHGTRPAMCARPRCSGRTVPERASCFLSGAMCGPALLYGLRLGPCVSAVSPGKGRAGCCPPLPESGSRFWNLALTARKLVQRKEESASFHMYGVRMDGGFVRSRPSIPSQELTGGTCRLSSNGPRYGVDVYTPYVEPTIPCRGGLHRADSIRWGGR